MADSTQERESSGCAARSDLADAGDLLREGGGQHPILEVEGLFLSFSKGTNNITN